MAAGALRDPGLLCGGTASRGHPGPSLAHAPAVLTATCPAAGSLFFTVLPSLGAGDLCMMRLLRTACMSEPEVPEA